MRLDEFLAAKPLFYQRINYKRMPAMWEILRKSLPKFEVVQLIGTNGKGSTGRFLSQMLHASGASVGHYTSPHIFKFNERFWLNSKILSDDELLLAHQKLTMIIGEDLIKQASYFEYATMLGAVLFADKDFFVCEAGMGGELDATSCFLRRLSLFTPIGLDHTSTLGNSIELIARTKFNAISNLALVNDTMNEKALKIGVEIAKQKGSSLHLASEMLLKDELQAINSYSQKYKLPDFLKSNLTLAVAAFKTLMPEANILKSLKDLGELELNGRAEMISPNLCVDVGHNELGARALINRFHDRKIRLVYNSFADKDYKAILEIFAPFLSDVRVYEYKSHDRELVGYERIKSECARYDIECEKFDNQDMKNLKNGSKNSDFTLVFGSFHLVEAFLNEFYSSKDL